ncbi:TMEM175 family protein [Herbiconiux sp. KACC 21604]|uniref:TMEM175 family protein n=1 Tax=unclassified Herbiconiux TaxID=2618217 RepID=UPI00149223D2|nr:TMEM175 family protein [Herbiconiux sp. SALV-R1]QJU55802.1 DUF1211 domain-containing protein [Herbiconiux sp. SALV-R1]WPO87015.1 TMEM175 family protein [Herbiconiux sp. KACC 21604]
MHTERGFDRLVNFSDAVVAIAITLLILPLVDLAADLKDTTVLDMLESNWPQFLVFIISFAVIGRFWINHHRLYENVIDYSPALLWVNLLWLLTIVFLPFPTELISSTGQNNPSTAALYVGTMVLTTAAGAWQVLILIRNPHLQAEAVRGQLRMGPSLIALVLMLVVFVMVIAVPQFGLLWLFLLVLTGPGQAAYSRRYKRLNPGQTLPPE